MLRSEQLLKAHIKCSQELFAEHIKWSEQLFEEHIKMVKGVVSSPASDTEQQADEDETGNGERPNESTDEQIRASSNWIENHIRNSGERLQNHIKRAGQLFEETDTTK